MIGWIGKVRGKARSRRWLPIAATIIALLVLTVFLQRHREPFLRLTPAGSFSVNGEFPSENPFFIRGLRYGSWHGDDRNTGTLTSEPFAAPARIAFMVVGYPNHRGEHLELVSVHDPRARIDVRVAADPRESWQLRSFVVPPSWRGQRVVFVATDAGRAWGDWIGIADLRPAGFGDTIAEAVAPLGNDVRIRLLILTAIALMLVVPVFGLSACICRRLDFPRPMVYTMSWLLLGATAEITFFMTMVSVPIVSALLMLATAGGTLLTFRTLRDTTSRNEFKTADVWGPFALSAFVSVSYAALLSLGIPGNGAPGGGVGAWLKMPPDNVLPHILALHIAAHSPPKPFFGDWLTSDRPPLQAGFDLLISALTPFVDDRETRYQAIAMVLQSTIFGALYTLGRLVGLSKLRCVGALLLCWMSGFFFLNGVFVWPKLLAAAYGAFAIDLAIAADMRRPVRAVLVGASTGLGLLAHGGIIFTVPALGLAWILRDGKAAVRPLMIAAVALVAVNAPWVWYQKAYDPPGDRLLKWHLAGQIGVTSEDFTSALIHAYSRTDLRTIIHNKIENVRFIAGIDFSLPLRDRQFFVLRYALSALFIPYLAALLFVTSRQRTLRWAAHLAWIALGSNVVWCLAMYGPSTTSVHQGSYLTVALMCLAGGIVVTEWIPVYCAALVAQAALFIAAWLPLYDLRAAATLGRVCDIAVLLSLVFLALKLLWRPLVTRMHEVRWPDWPRDGRGRLTLHASGELVTLGLVMLAMLVLTWAEHSSLALLLQR